MKKNKKKVLKMILVLEGFEPTSEDEDSLESEDEESSEEEFEVRG